MNNDNSNTNTNSNDFNNNVERAYTRKRKRWERFDGYKLKNIPSFQKLIPFTMRTRAGSTNYFEIVYDASEIVKYIDEKNRNLEKNSDSNNPTKQYTYTQFFIALIVRMFALRPRLNRFVSRKNIYQRHNIEVAYMVKKDFSDDGDESTTVETFERDSNIDDVGNIIHDSIKGVKETTEDNTGNFADFLFKLPNFLVSFIIWIFDATTYIGYCPAVLRKIDIMQSSVVFTNVGSIGLETTPHHHLYDRGTSSILISVGRIRKEKHLTDNGIEERDVVDFKISMDERIADGFYFVKSFELLKEILDNPQQLDDRLKEVPIDE
ncbi:MAG: 2-oxo acid dehydrogenase subunit E2 [Methanobrevibacter sp.]|nr:2-oxo acid dehydrogenase subunit E2 [Methanobrevibacter sp.]